MIIKQHIGIITNYYKKVGVAEIKLWQDLKIGDEIIIQGNKTGSITQKVESMQVDGENIEYIKEGLIGLKTDTQVRQNDHVYKKVEIENMGE